MKCKVLRRWQWQKGFLQPGQEIDLPTKHAAMLRNLGVVEIAQHPVVETASVEPPEQPIKRKRGRPRKYPLPTQE